MCPWAFPIVSHRRKNLHHALREQGIPAFTWGGVVHKDLPIDDFPDAEFLYDRLVLLPIHQSMKLSDMTTVVRVLRTTLEREPA